MAGNTNGQRRRRRSEDENLIARITARYADEYDAGRNPRMEDYIRRYPKYRAELMDFAFYFHTVQVNLPPIEEAVYATAPAPAAERAWEQVSRELGLPPVAAALAASAAPTTQASAEAPTTAMMLETLAKRGIALNISPRQLAQRVGVSNDFIGRLDARTIKPETIPPMLMQRLAAALQVTVETIVAYFRTPAQAAVHFYADQAPETQQQEPFLEAVNASKMSPEAKSEWAEIAARELPS